MPHVYDTGQLVPQRTALRAAVIQRLRLLARPTLYARHVGPLAAQLDGTEADAPEIVRALQGNSPAVLVALGDGTSLAAGMGANRSRIEIELSVYVLSTHGRDLVAGRLAGDVRTADVTQDPGIETMVEHVEELLTGWDPGIPGVEEIRLQREGELVTSSDATIWEVEFSVRVDRTAGQHPRLTTLLASIAAAHNAAGAGDANPVIDTVTDVEAP